MLRRRGRLIASLAIVAFWTVMVGLLIRREVFAPGLDVPSGGLVQALGQAQDNWMGVFLADGKHVGYVHTRSDPESRGGVLGARTAMQARLHLALLGEAATIRVAGRAWLALNGETADFDFSVHSGAHELRMVGEVADGYLQGKVHTGGEAIPLRVPVQGNTVLSGGLGGTINVPALEPGQEFTVNAFDPLTMSVNASRVRYAGKDTLTVDGVDYETTIVSVTTGGMESKVWVDEHDQVLRAQTAYGFSLVRMSPREAAEDIEAEGAASPDMLTALAIHPTGAAAFRGARELSFRVSGLADDVALPSDDVQRSTGDGTFAISVPDMPSPDTVEGVPLEADAYLASDALIQADHATIRTQAEAIVGEERTVWGKANAIYGWVYANIDKVPVLSVPSALDVLKTRQGDCNEHTVLFTALARAVGVPTRIALGVVWSDELDGFYYHAWPEVYVDRWIWMDPTLGQPLADATHVKLLSGDIAEWPRLMAFLGRLQIEIESIR